jgi:hypothetical protein
MELPHTEEPLATNFGPGTPFKAKDDIFPTPLDRPIPAFHIPGEPNVLQGLATPHSWKARPKESKFELEGEKGYLQRENTETSGDAKGQQQEDSWPHKWKPQYMFTTSRNSTWRAFGKQSKGKHTLAGPSKLHTASSGWPGRHDTRVWDAPDHNHYKNRNEPPPFPPSGYTSNPPSGHGGGGDHGEGGDPSGRLGDNEQNKNPALPNPQDPPGSGGGSGGGGGPPNPQNNFNGIPYPGPQGPVTYSTLPGDAQLVVGLFFFFFFFE